MCDNNYEPCLWQYQSEWFTLYHTNPSHEVLLTFVWLKFSSFGWDIDMRRIRSRKTLSLGIHEAPQGNIKRRLKCLSLGMPRKAFPLSSSKLSVYLTRSYIFIRLDVFKNPIENFWIVHFYSNSIKWSSKQNSYHVANENIAPSEVTDNVGDERGDDFRRIPKLSCLDIPLILPWGALGIPKLRVFSLLSPLILISHPKLENFNHTKLNGTFWDRLVW